VDDDCDREHYWLARRPDLAQTRRFAALFPSYRIGKAEKAYIPLRTRAKRSRDQARRPKS
jgi:hypothetical protein